MTNAEERTWMKDQITIKAVKLYPVTTPRLYGEPSQHIIVRLTAADGTTGWGEISDVSHLPAMMPDVKDLESCLQALLVGRDAMNLNQIEDAMTGELSRYALSRQSGAGARGREHCRARFESAAVGHSCL